MLDHFGTPADLAASYLEGEEIEAPMSNKLWGLSKSLLIVASVLITVVVIIIGLIAWYWTKDSFDYADETAVELDQTGAGWQSVSWQGPLLIKANQAKVVLYWQQQGEQQNKLSWSCKRTRAFNSKEDIAVQQNECLFILPRQVVRLDSMQSTLVVIKPKASMNIGLEQSNLKLAQKGQAIHYVNNACYSNFESLRSTDDAAIKLTIEAMESIVDVYQYWLG